MKQMKSESVSEKVQMEVSDSDNQDASEDGTTNGTKKKSFWRQIKAGVISVETKILFT